MSETAWSQQYSAPLPQKKKSSGISAWKFSVYESQSLEEVKNGDH